MSRKTTPRETEKPKKLTRAQKKEIDAVLRKYKGDGKPRTAQATIPYEAIYPDGVCRIDRRTFSKCIAFEDISYQLAQPETRTAIFEHLCDLYNYVDASIHVQLSFLNRKVDPVQYAKSFEIAPQGDDFDDIRAEYTAILQKQLASGNNGIVKTKYLTFTIEADNLKTARARLTRIGLDLLGYTLLLDRATLSQRNNWVDEHGRIYVIYPLAHLAKDLGYCVSSVTRSFAELEKADLVERVHSGFSKPSRILLKVPHSTQNCTGTICTDAQSDCAETHSMIAQKCTPNQRNKNNLNDNHLIRTNNVCLSFGEYQNVFLTEKEYKRLKADFTGLDSLIEQLSEYIQSTGRKYADHAATLRIWAKRQSAEKKAAPGIPDYTFKEGESL